MYLFKFQRSLQCEISDVVASVVKLGEGLTLIQEGMEDALIHSLVYCAPDGLNVHGIIELALFGAPEAVL